MRTGSRICALAATAAVGLAAIPAHAQMPPGCPPNYYLATDGNCYPGPPPVYPQPVYQVAPPVDQPPLVFDGLVLGIGLGIAALASHGHGHGGPPVRHPIHGEEEHHH